MTHAGDHHATFRLVGLASACLLLAGCSSDASPSAFEGDGGAGGVGDGAPAGSSGDAPGPAGSMGGSGGASYAAGGAGNGGAAPSSAGAPGTASGGSPGSGGMGIAGSGPSSSSGGAGGAPGSGGMPVAGAGGSPAGGAGGESTSGSIWKPMAGTTWQWQLTGKIDTSLDVAVYDIDGFDTDASTVKALHDQGRKVICYLSVGSYEDWRPDASQFPSAVLGKNYPGWPGERFVDIRAQSLRDIMTARFDMCKQKGFDGVEPDNMDVYEDNSGFPLTQKDGIDYASWMATEIHARGLNIGQKNASEIAQNLEPTFDWMLTEDCYDQGWCADVKVYVDHDKPVFMAEYTDTGVDFASACAWAQPKKYSPILKGRDLDAPVQFCQ